jgi:Family of unknown function (DUF695)
MVETSVVAEWATAISKNAQNGRVIIFRYARSFKPTFDRGTQPDRIIIIWKYQSESGQPVAEEHQRMNLLEDALEPTLNQAEFATLALISTGEGLREWTYYTKSEDEFIDRLNLALEGMPAFPIEIHTASDPRWIMYQEFKARVRVTES